jgi:hypothetical protein
MDTRETQYVAVYGELYQSAKLQMQLNQTAIEQQIGVGFKDYKSCAKWAHEHLLDIMVLGKAQHLFYYATHHGEVLNKRSWLGYYGNILFYTKEDLLNETKKKKKIVWLPSSFEAHDCARVYSEQPDGVRQPLLYRDYFVPTGFYSEAAQAFNIAQPFPVFAKETGRDTSHIYTYIDHIAGPCALWLLAWLRAKMVSPLTKTEVVPIIVSRAQGSGKTTFAEVICKGLFGDKNVLVTDQYDSQSRFNSDYADALIVSQEEKEERDKRNTAATLKSRATATTIRKEHKGLDPFYQKSYTEFIVTTNDDVPIKFEDSSDQRRFMVMEADSNFTRKTSLLADDVFTKLYGRASPNGPLVNTPFVDDPTLIAQFKHELFTRKDIANVTLRNFPKTQAYARCFNVPRTNEAVEIESIVKSLVPFIKASLLEKKLVTTVQLNDTTVLRLADFVGSIGSLYYVAAAFGQIAHIAVCRPVVFYDGASGKPFQHSVVERALISCKPWLVSEYGITVMSATTPIIGGFPGVKGRHAMGPVARFALADDMQACNNDPAFTFVPLPSAITLVDRVPPREGARLRVNSQWRVDPDGEFETVNELKEGTMSLEDKSASVLYMDTFLLESDEVSKVIYSIEQNRINNAIKDMKPCVSAESLFMERLALQRAEAKRLFDNGVTCRVVYSGSKSVHILIRVKDSPATLDEYKWLHAYLCSTVSDKLKFDLSTQDPARLTRAPITCKRVSTYCGVDVEGTQALLYEDFSKIYDVAWRPQYTQWLNRPLKPWETKGRRLRPVKLEYQEAMQALLYGTFWTDSRWNGQRQTVFFPAYRICRILGYTHDELWGDGGILDGLDGYYRKSEREYWKSRATSSIIKTIDDDVDNEVGNND